MPVSRLRVAFLAALLFCTSAAAAQRTQAKHAQIELLSQRSANSSGSELLLGVHFVLESGWHIYWTNPGDSGQPPVFKWQMPAGFSAGEILWSRPERMQSSPQLADFGYHDDVLLIVPMHGSLPAAVKAPLEIGLEAKWLICREVCIADHANLHLALPATSAKADPSSAQLFTRAQALVPKPLPRVWRTSFSAQKDSFVLFVQAGKKVSKSEFFPLEPGQVDNAAPQHLQPLPQGAKITLKKSDYLTRPISVLRGVLVLPDGNAYRIEAPATKPLQ